MRSSHKSVVVTTLLMLALAGCGDTGPTVVDGNGPESTPLPTPQPGGTEAAAPAEPATQAPAAGEPAAVGDRIQLGDSQYFTVREAKIWPGDDFIQPDEGQQFVSVLVQIEGIDPEGSSYNPFFFTARDDDGFEYNFSAFGEDPQLQSGNDLGAGETVSGWITFEVPAEVTELTLTYQPDFFDIGDPARVLIQIPQG